MRARESTGTFFKQTQVSVGRWVQRNLEHQSLQVELSHSEVRRSNSEETRRRLDELFRRVQDRKRASWRKGG